MNTRSKSWPEPEREHEQKHRRCLVCHKTFVSEWAGERICKRCKSTSVWREGKAAEISTEKLDEIINSIAIKK